MLFLTQRTKFIFSLQDNKEILITTPHNIKLVVTKDILVPHLYTFEFINLLSEFIHHSNIISCIDLGTGSGVIAISLKKIHKNMNMYATDTSPHAIRITKRNAQLNKTQITLIHNKNNAHWLTGLDIFPELVICNPPFLSDKSFFSEKLATEFPEIKIEPQDSIRSFDPNGMNHYKTIINEFVSISHNNSRLKYLALEMPDNLESALSTELNKKSHSLSWNFLLASDKHKRFVIIKKMN